jgi:hypothetical protein
MPLGLVDQERRFVCFHVKPQMAAAVAGSALGGNCRGRHPTTLSATLYTACCASGY